MLKEQPIEREPHGVHWIFDMQPPAWDKALAALSGHPLQSALWGDARSVVDGIPNQRWAAAEPGGRIVLMARIEARRIPVAGRVAWIPKGPATAPSQSLQQAHRELLDRLRDAGYLICIDDPYPERLAAASNGRPLLPVPHTILVDLTVGKERLLAGLDSQWRYGVRASQRAGITVTRSAEPGAISEFYGLCRRLSLDKGFALPGTETLMRTLCTVEHGPDAEAVLFLAHHGDERIAAGALVMRCGLTAHYMWGTTDRAFAKQRPGEAVQWAVIEWCLENGLRIYDLEGIDPKDNPSTSQFKRKMGGKEVVLPGKQAVALGVRGALLMHVGRWLGKL